MSFPSGHSSTAASGLVYASFYLAHRFGPSDSPAARLVHLAPSLVALLVGYSRVADFAHHWQDVLVGLLVGGGSAYLGFRVHFHPGRWGDRDKARGGEALEREEAYPLGPVGVNGTSAAGPSEMRGETMGGAYRGVEGGSNAV